MLGSDDHDVGNDAEAKHRFYSVDEQRVLQSFLATLANLELDYERERERVTSSTRNPSLRELLLRKLAERHRIRREPYIRHVSLLQAKMMPSP